LFSNFYHFRSTSDQQHRKEGNRAFFRQHGSQTPNFRYELTCICKTRETGGWENGKEKADTVNLPTGKDTKKTGKDYRKKTGFQSPGPVGPGVENFGITGTRDRPVP